MKILLCFGTRPEAIKMAPVIYELQRRKIESKICITAQHREMLDQVVDFFEITPDYDLNLMTPGQSLNMLCASIFKNIDSVLEKEKPDLILVHGDTTTSMICGIAAFHRGIRVGHVEAGLRTHNLHAPYPEEMNRQVSARIASFHFAPTIEAKKNLLKEDIGEDSILVTGNTVVDALKWSEKRIRNLSTVEISKKLKVPPEILERYVLVTGHRRENFGEGLKKICEALNKLSEEIPIIFPVHLNPNVKNEVHRLLGSKKNVFLIDPVSYPQMLFLIKNAEFIISDSGGIQEEAPSFGKKVLLTRENSERPEGIYTGCTILVGTDTEKILAESINLLKQPSSEKRIENPYGDGNASEKIVSHLLERFD